MKLSNPLRYELTFVDRGYYTVKSPTGDNKFSAPASLKATPKLYVVSDNKFIHYVGITSQPMSTRLRYGINAKGTNGYHGYKWKNSIDKLKLFIWILEDVKIDKAYHELETIEAEVVYLCRLHSDQWPKSQNEIHFHKSEEFHRDSAQKIYNCIKMSFNL